MATIEGDGRGVARSATDASGRYRLEGLASGAYQVTAAAPSGGSRSEAVTIDADATVDFDLPIGRLSGVVIEEGTGQPLADARGRVDGVRGRTLTDGAGRFVIEGLESRAYRLTVERASFVLVDRTVSETDLGSEITIEMRRGEGLGLVARDAAWGVPLRRVDVRILDGQRRTVHLGRILLDSEGRGEVPSLPPGTYLLRAQSPGLAPLPPLPVTVPAPTLELAFAAGGGIEVRVGPETRALGNPRARLVQPGGATYLLSVFDEDGVLQLSSSVRRLEDVAPGAYTLAVEGGASRAVSVTAGGTAVVQLP